VDLTRSKTELVIENALLRQQLIVLKRHTKRPALTWRDRTLFVLLASKLRNWKQALLIVQPETLLRWHRELFRRIWRRKSRSKQKPGRPPLTDDLIALIQRMAKENRTWGAERIRGELLKLGIRVSKSTIQKYMKGVRESLSPKQPCTWPYRTSVMTSGSIPIPSNCLRKPLIASLSRLSIKSKKIVRSLMGSTATTRYCLLPFSSCK